MGKNWYGGMHEMIGMKLSAGVVALLLVLVCWGAAAETEAGNMDFTVADLASQPVQFIKNMGQSPDIIQYQAKTRDFSFDFTQDGILITGVPDEGSDLAGIQPLVVTLEGADTRGGIESLDQLDGYANFLIGNDSSEFQTRVPWFGSIRYPSVLPGINLTYSGSNGVLKREYFVSPGADPLSIRLKYDGAENVTLTDEGTLEVSTRFGTLVEAAPVSYQDIDGSRVNVSSAYVLQENGLVGFTVGEYDPAYPLVIDPYLEYSTYLGGTLQDFGMDIAMDTAGNAYVVGHTYSCDFPIRNQIDITSPIIYNGTTCHDSLDVFVTKISNPAGGNASIVWSTYIGGENADFGAGIAVDSMTDVYITGWTFSSDFPTVLQIQNGARLHGSSDAFVMKIMADGTNLWYSSFLGGNFVDEGHDIAVDSIGAAFITGKTVGNSPYKKVEENFPVTANAYQTSPNTNAVMGDAFASKISPTGNSLEYSTYISGNDQDSGNGIAVDGQGMAYIVGTTTSDNLVPSTVPGYQKTRKGGQDAFLFKMNFVASSPPIYATYLGGATGYDYGEAVAVDQDFSAYVTGATASTDFPNTTYAKQRTKGWPYDYFDKDAFVTRFSADGTSLEYSTYLGGSSNEWAYGIAVDEYRRAFVTGYTKSESFPKYDSIKTVTNSGDQDGFLTCVNPTGSDWVYSTVFGGYRDETSHGVAVSDDGNTTVVTGWTDSPSILDLVSGTNCGNNCFPVVNWINNETVYWHPYIGGNFSGEGSASFDAFVMKFGKSSLLPSFTPNETCGNAPLTILFTDTSSASANIVSRVWNFGDGNITSFGSAARNVVHTYTNPGTYTATLRLISSSGSAISSPATIIACNPWVSANYSIDGANMSRVPINLTWHTAYTFRGRANFTPAMWDWNFDDSSANVTGQVVSRAFSTQRIYNVTMTARTGGCCDNASIRYTIRAVAPPFAEFNNTTVRTICPGDSVSFADNSYDDANYGPPESWLWDFGDGGTSTEQNPTHQYLHSGLYTVSLTVSNVAGTSLPEIKEDFVLVRGEAVAGFDADNKTGYAPLLVNFTDLSTGYVSDWRWDFGDGNITEHEKNVSHTYYDPGRYYVNLTVWDGCGGVDFSNRTEYITVNANINPIINMGRFPSPTLQNKTNGTSPLPVYFQGNTTGGFLIDEFWWDYGDGNVTSHRTRGLYWPADNSWVNTSHTYYALGDYTPVLNVINNTWPGTATSGHQYDDYIGVYCPLIANFTAPSTGVIGQQIQFTDTSLCTPALWNYSFGDGSYSNAQNPRHAYSTNGPFQVWLNVTNKYGAQNYTWPIRVINIEAGANSSQMRFIPQDIPLVAGTVSARKVQIILDRTDFGLTSYTIGVDLDNTTSSNFYAVADRPWWIDADKFAYNVKPVGQGQYFTISAWNSTGGIPAGSVNVSLGNITIVGSATGTNVMRMNSSSTAQYGSLFYSLTNTPAVIRSYRVTALPGYSSDPADLKPDNLHDGLIDDFDGNGVVNSHDITVFFQAWSAGSLSSYPTPPFDYNNNGMKDTDDIVKFFTAYSQW